MKKLTETKKTNKDAVAEVYFTKRITSEALMDIYKTLNREAKGKVAVKLSTGEPGGHYFLSPKLIEPLVKEVNGTIVECNTAYGGPRSTTHQHQKVAKDHGFTAIAEVDIMDSEGEIELPIKGGKILGTNIVGSHLSNYDFMIDLVHFKGHMMGGFGGAIKNLSIGVASSNGKLKIHNGGKIAPFNMGAKQEPFLECMAEAAKSVADYFDGNIIYINVMNNLSIDCDCDSHPSAPELEDIGILASLDPTALDQACVDLIYESTKGNNKPLIRRIEDRKGIHTLEHADAIGFGTRNYELYSIDE